MGVSVVASLGAALLVLLALDTDPARRGLARRRIRGVERSGRTPSGALAALGRRLSGGVVEPADEALVGIASLVFVVSVVAVGVVGGLLALLGAVVAVAARRRARRLDRVRHIERHLPEVIDLLGLVVGAGRPTVSALADISVRVTEPFRSELAAVAKRTGAGEPFTESVRRLQQTLGPGVSPVVYAVTAAEIDGAPLGPALERAADEAHRRRRVRAEEAARRVPVLMLFPLVLCILPAFCLLTIVPVLVGTIADLRFPS